MALTEQELQTLSYEPDVSGHFGDYGGRYVSETLMAALNDLDQRKIVRALIDIDIDSSGTFVGSGL